MKKLTINYKENDIFIGLMINTCYFTYFSFCIRFMLLCHRKFIPLQFEFNVYKVLKLNLFLGFSKDVKTPKLMDPKQINALQLLISSSTTSKLESKLYEMCLFFYLGIASNLMKDRYYIHLI